MSRSADRDVRPADTHDAGGIPVRNGRKSHLGTDELEVINVALSDLLGVKPAALAHSGEAALTDELVFCGLLGGKNVGKSTLINALARVRVSVDSAPTGRGTERPMVYVHESAEAAALARLRKIGEQQRLDVTRHRADAIRNLVLVDLPDFDSEFTEHLAVVQLVAPLMDRVIWVATPRKLGDRAWLEMFKRVIKDARNVHGVLNKIDELLADRDPFGDGDPRGERRAGDGHGDRAERFRRRHDEWLAEVSRAAGCTYGDDHRFLIAAAFTREDGFVRHVAELWDDPAWSRYSDDRETVGQIARLAIAELDRLRDSVLSPLTTRESRAIKAANRQCEIEENAARIRDHYDLDRTTQQLEQACEAEYQRQALDDAVDEPLRDALVASAEGGVRSDSELADELLERRVEQWPLLRLVYWPFGWLSRALGRRVGAPSHDRAAARRDQHAPDKSAVQERADLLRSRLLADFASLTRTMRIERELPRADVLAKRLRARLATLPSRYESELIDRIREADRRPSIIKRAGLWLILLWFPFAQPILAGLLEMFAETGQWRLAHGAYRVVSALSAVHLLSGFAVVAGVYVALLAAMYVRSLRYVRRARDDDAGVGTLDSAVERLLIERLLEPLMQPFQDRRDRLRSLTDRLDRLTKET